MLINNHKMDAESDDSISPISPQTNDFENGHRPPRSSGAGDESTNRHTKLPTLPTFSGTEAANENFSVDFLKTLSAQKQFYNNFGMNMNMLATRAIMNVKQESSVNTGDILFRRDSPSSNEQQLNTATTCGRENSGQSVTGVRMSPNALAESLQSNDVASMVFRRNKKHKPQRKQINIYDPLLPPAGDNSYNHIDTINLTGTNGGDISIGVSSSNPSSSLHHFTTRYTIESPSDPSRMGIELVLNHDNDEPVIEVECGGNRGLLYINKLCQGSKGQSILFNNDWLTPNEFQFVSGRETAKDWKRSIRHCGKSLKTLMTKGVLQVHPPVCECAQCQDHHAHPMRNTSSPNSNFTSTNIITSNNLALDGASKQLPVTPKSTNLEKWPSKSSAGGLNTIISQLHSRAANEQSSNTSNAESVASPVTDGDESSPAVAMPTNTRKRSHDHEDSTSEEETTMQRKNVKHPELTKQFNGNLRRDQAPAFMPQDDRFNPMLSIFNPTLTPMERQRQVYAHLFTSMLAGDKNKQPPQFPLFDNNQRKRAAEVNYKRPAGYKKKLPNNRSDGRRMNELPKPSFAPAWPVMNGWTPTEFARPTFYGGINNGNLRMDQRNFKENVATTTMHHRPSNDNMTLKDVNNNNESKDTPMVVLQKHSEDASKSLQESSLKISDDIPRRQSSSAPPPPSGQDKIQPQQRPTSAHTKSIKPAQSTSPVQTCSKQQDIKPTKVSLLDGISELAEWNVDDVCVYIKSIGPAFNKYVKVFEDHSINGRALVLLTERHMVDEMGLKLGHALNILSRVREKLGILPDLFKCCHTRDVDAMNLAAHNYPANSNTFP